MPQCQPPRPQASRVPRAPTATASAPRAVARAAPAKREAPASTTKVPDSKRTAPASTRVPDTKRAAPASTRVADAKKNVPPSTRVPDTKHAAQAKWAATPRPSHRAAPATRSATASKSRQPRDAAVTPASTASASLPSGSALGVAAAAAAAASVSPRRVLELAPGLRGPASSSRCRRQSLNGTVYDLNNVTWSELDGTVIPAEEPDTTTVADPDVLDVQGRSDGDVEAFVRTGRWPRARVVHDDSFDVGALRCRIDRLDEEADRYRACIELAYQGTIAGRRVRRAPTWVKDMIAREREDSS